MPIGSWSAYTEVIRIVLMNNPSSVLDVGVGFGMNGAGVRNWLDLGYRPLFKTKLEGIEPYRDYRNPVWDLYNKVHECSVQEYLEKEDEFFDLVVMTDVIEHFDKEEGVRVICELQKRCRVLLISTPAVFIAQGAAYGNEYEIHRSYWQVSDLHDMGFTFISKGLPDRYGHKMLIAEWLRR